MSRDIPAGKVLEGKWKNNTIYLSQQYYEEKYQAPLFIIVEDDRYQSIKLNSSLVVETQDMGSTVKNADPGNVLKAGFWFGGAGAVVASQLGTQAVHLVAVKYNDGEKSLFQLNGASAYNAFKRLDFLIQNKKPEEKVSKITNVVVSSSNSANRKNVSCSKEKSTLLESAIEISHSIMKLKAQISRMWKYDEVKETDIREKSSDWQKAMELKAQNNELEKRLNGLGFFKKKEKERISSQIAENNTFIFNANQKCARIAYQKNQETEKMIQIEVDKLNDEIEILNKRLHDIVFELLEIKGWVEASQVLDCMVNYKYDDFKRSIFVNHYFSEINNRFLSAGYSSIIGICEYEFGERVFDSSHCENVIQWREIKAVQTGYLSDTRKNYAIGITKNNSVIYDIEKEIIRKTNNQVNKCSIKLNNWKNIASITSKANHVVGLTKEGTVVASGNNKNGECDISGWKDIMSVTTSCSCSDPQTIGIRVDGTAITTDRRFDISQWSDIISIAAGDKHIVAVSINGKIMYTGYNTAGQLNVDGWYNIISVAAGREHTVGLRKDGKVIATGNNENGQCDVSGWSNVIAISAGNDFTLGLKKNGSIIIAGNKIGTDGINNSYTDSMVKDWLSDNKKFKTYWPMS